MWWGLCLPRGLSASWDVCPGGVCQGVFAQGGLPRGCVCPGVSAQGGVCPGWGVAVVSTTDISVDRMTDMCKTLPFCNYVADGNKNAFQYDRNCPLFTVGGSLSGRPPDKDTLPPMNRMTDASNNITLPKTSFAGGN